MPLRHPFDDVAGLKMDVFGISARWGTWWPDGTLIGRSVVARVCSQEQNGIEVRERSPLQPMMLFAKNDRKCNRINVTFSILFFESRRGVEL